MNSDLRSTGLDEAQLDKALGDVASSRIQITGLCEAIGGKVGLTVHELRSPDRTMAIARTRQVVMYVAHKQGLSKSEIGRFFKRDQRTVAHAVRLVTDLLEGARDE